jgi:hypothetical protein
MKKIAVWYSTLLSLISAVIYILAGAGIISIGLVEEGEAPPFIMYVAGVFYVIFGVLVRINKRWVRLSLAVINGLIILIFYQMWWGNTDVLMSPGGLGTKIAQFLLETGLIYLIIKTWNDKGEAVN